ncbi:MAG: putative DNA binding domain-containing protein [Bacteroidales bacterium]|nr:putative DNA binding domain-containing protein [Bacteroidales bacterium]MCF8455352.1 putative DNA binding domain-containing protein [Bacteroidales bacterium]
MTEKELQEYLTKRFPTENERCEWKQCSNLKHFVRGKEGEDIISYISAISNMGGGFLIIGVQDKSLTITGIQDFSNYDKENIKKSLFDSCINLNTEQLDIEELTCDDTHKTVWVFSIPKHQKRLPVYAHKKAWQRVGDSLMIMKPSRMEAILSEPLRVDDWSAGIIPDATIDDLDEEAISKARIEFVKRNPKYKDEVESWENDKFLDKAKLTIKGKITRTAMILLGKEEEEHFLGSSVKIRWNLKTVDNQDKDYEIFSIPLLLTVDQVLAKIRNLKYRYLRDNTLFPDEFLRYEPFNIREPLHNAIAHQDYTKAARINVVEFEDDHLVFSNYGNFLPESVENVVLKDTPEEQYRNSFLVEAMKNLDMIETQGGGIRKLFDFQRQRFFPMPEYDLSDGKVKVSIIGKILDEEFARILIHNPEITIEEILMLDKVQKRKILLDQEFNYLKKKEFVEGRKPNIYLSHKVVEPTENDDLKAEYICNKGFDDEYCKDLIVEYLTKWKVASRKQIEHLLWDKLSDVLDEKNKKNKVQNLLQSLRRGNIIKLDIGKKWILC